MYLTDTHTHLYKEEFDVDREAVMKRAIRSGVERFYLSAIDSTYHQAMEELSAAYPDRCFSMMGLHPVSVDGDYEKELAVVGEALEKKTYAAIGEIGIDLHWDDTFFAEQQDAFRRQIQWAKDLGYPIVIHCRKAFDEIFEVLDEMNDERLFGIFHCFTGSPEQAQRVIDYGGFKLGIGGIVTFKNAGLDKTVEGIELEHLVLETDSPYLAPVPNRGKRNESAWVLQVAEKVAELKGLSLEEVAEVTNRNAEAVFCLPER